MMFGEVFDVEEYLANEPLSTEADLPMEFEWGKDNDIVVPVHDESDLLLAVGVAGVGVGLLAYGLSGLFDK